MFIYILTTLLFNFNSKFNNIGLLKLFKINMMHQYYKFLIISKIK